mmetsp:Transcript_16445/g.36032  ORF Transcript_16445/g.36032 Transcript_16445/m.36032 type:complete len:162 (+) Transcript_16445:3-488(+)
MKKLQYATWRQESELKQQKAELNRFRSEQGAHAKLRSEMEELKSSCVYRLQPQRLSPPRTQQCKELPGGPRHIPAGPHHDVEPLQPLQPCNEHYASYAYESYEEPIVLHPFTEVFRDLTSLDKVPTGEWNVFWSSLGFSFQLGSDENSPIRGTGFVGYPNF